MDQFPAFGPSMGLFAGSACLYWADRRGGKREETAGGYVTDQRWGYCLGVMGTLFNFVNLFYSRLISHLFPFVDQQAAAH